MSKKYFVRLTNEEREFCEEVVRTQTGKSEKFEVDPGIRTRKRGFLDGQVSGLFWREVKACQGVRLFSPW